MSIQANTYVEIKKLLKTPINKLPLSIEGSPLQNYVDKLYSELREHDVAFLPKCYLSDEWGCPHQIPLIGIPFYLADTTLSRLEGKYTNIEAENEVEIMKYLRHEAGHALNYAYQLFYRPDWEEQFGSFSLPYSDRYQRIPHHKAFVIHLEDWYAQKHPDEDFAETFAVWLTPGSDWKNRYLHTPAYKKLEYVNTIMQIVKTMLPIVSEGEPDMPIEKIDMTLEDWYEEQRDSD